MTTIHEMIYGDNNPTGPRRCPGCGRRVRPFYIDGTRIPERRCPWCDGLLVNGFRRRRT